MTLIFTIIILSIHLILSNVNFSAQMEVFYEGSLFRRYQTRSDTKEMVSNAKSFIDTSFRVTVKIRIDNKRRKNRVRS
jgi:hypothetical protein